MSIENARSGETNELRELVLKYLESGQYLWGDTHQFADVFSQGALGDLSKARTRILAEGDRLDVEVDDGRTAAGFHAHIDFQPDGWPAFMALGSTVNGDTRTVLRYLTSTEYTALAEDLELLSQTPGDINHLTS
jgi:hypothetical protein